MGPGGAAWGPWKGAVEASPLPSQLAGVQPLEVNGPRRSWSGHTGLQEIELCNEHEVLEALGWVPAQSHGRHSAPVHLRLATTASPLLSLWPTATPASMPHPCLTAHQATPDPDVSAHTHSVPQSLQVKPGCSGHLRKGSVLSGPQRLRGGETLRR